MDKIYAEIRFCVLNQRKTLTRKMCFRKNIVSFTWTCRKDQTTPKNKIDAQNLSQNVDFI